MSQPRKMKLKRSSERLKGATQHQEGEKSESCERVKKYRERVKLTDNKKHEELKRIDRLRKQESRKRIKEQMVNDIRLQKHVREKKNEETRRYRAKKKSQGNTSVVYEGARSDAARQTAAKRKDKVRKQRNKESVNINKKKNVLRVQKWRMKIKLASVYPQKSKFTATEVPPMSEETNPRNVESSTPGSTAEVGNIVLDSPVPMNERSGENKTAEPVIHSENMNTPSPFPSYWCERRVVRSVKKMLPFTPDKRGRVVEKLMNSPRTANYLQKKPFSSVSAVQKQLQVGRAMLGVMKSSLSETKFSGTVSSDKARSYGHLKLIAGKSAVVRRYFQLRKKKKQLPENWWKDCARTRKTRRDRISDTIRDEIIDFFLLPEISRQVPNKRDVTQVINERGEKVKVQKHIMVMTLANAYNEYKVQNPDRKVGFTTFKKLKPKQVRKVSETNRRTCLCTTCCNVALLMESLKKFLKVTTVNPEAVTELEPYREMTKEKLSAATLCPYDPASANCLNRHCDQCGADELKKYFQVLLTKYKNDPVTWYKWQYITILKTATEKRCMSCKPCTTTVKELIDEFVARFKEYPAHVFRASWQHQQLTNCINQLKDGEVAIVMDFSENYSCRFQNEVQTAFFDQNQVTIHPMMCYYNKEIDGEGVRVKHAIIGISDDLKHDTCLVRSFQDKASTLLRNTIDVKKTFEWTDGCAAQYKGYAGFADISLQSKPLERCFFETSHGKNVCDGLGAVVKNVCYQAVISGKAVLSTAEDVYSYCQSHLAHDAKEVKRSGNNELSLRHFVYVCEIDTSHDREELKVETLAGTRKLHAVRNSPGNKYALFTRPLACFCNGCKHGEECLNKAYVPPWQSITLKKKVKKAAQTTSVAVGIDDEALHRGGTNRTNSNNQAGGQSSQKSVSSQPDPIKFSVGDFVAVMLLGRRKSAPASVYMAEIVRLQQDSITVKYMKKQGVLYHWSEPLEFSTEPTHSILLKMDAPTCVNRRQQFKFYDIKKVEEKMSVRKMKFQYA